jgi:hypothetical protein
VLCGLLQQYNGSVIDFLLSKCCKQQFEFESLDNAFCDAVMYDSLKHRKPYVTRYFLENFGDQITSQAIAKSLAMLGRTLWTIDAELYAYLCAYADAKYNQRSFDLCIKF